MKILLLSKYSRMGASSRLRALQFLPFLEEQGVQISVQTLFDDQYLEQLYKGGGRSLVLTAKRYFARFLFLFRVSSYDVIWIEKEVFPFCPAFFERLFNILNIPYVVDYDDAIFHNYDVSSNFIIRTLLGSKIDVVMRGAACVVAGNTYLANRAIEAGASKVEIVPTVVDRFRYSASLSRPQERMVIGWIGSPSTEKYVVEIREALKHAYLTYNSRLVLMGASTAVLRELDGMEVEVQSWSEGAEAEFIKSLDIGIMPLVDGLWEKGKCGYKLIQYMACGVPVIASPVGVNVDIVDGNQCGLLASSVTGWRDCLDRMLDDQDLRTSFGRNGLDAVENTFSLQVQAPRIRDILAGARSGNSAV